MTEFRKIEEPTRIRDTRTPRLLVLFWEGVPALLSHQGDEIDWELEALGVDGLLEHVGAPPSPGVWVWEGKLVDDGPGDWPGSREVALAGSWRAATKEELRRYADDEWVWEAPPRVARIETPRPGIFLTSSGEPLPPDPTSEPDDAP